MRVMDHNVLNYVPRPSTVVMREHVYYKQTYCQGVNGIITSFQGQCAQDWR